MAIQKHVSLERLQYFAEQFYNKIDQEKVSTQELADLLVKIGDAAVEANPEQGTEASPATGLYKLIEDGDANALAQAKVYADSAIAGLVNSAPETLDTLKELADALGNDENFATTISESIGKVDAKVGNAAADGQAATGLFADLEQVRSDITAVESKIPNVEELGLVNGQEVDTKISEAIANKADSDHNHDEAYAKIDHVHVPAELAYINEAYPDMANVKDALDELLYFNPSVKTFTASPSFGDYEIGHEITNPIMTWSYNKDIVSQSVTDCTVDLLARTATYAGTITTNKTFTVSAKDSKGTSCSRSGSFNFKHKRYFGVAQAPQTYDSEFILALAGKEFATSKNKDTFTLTAGEGEYFYYCYPASFSGTPTFNVGGFDGGFELAATIDFTNVSGATASYVIYKSENANLGTQSIIVK